MVTRAYVSPATTDANPSVVRILTWTFHRGADVLSCELGLTADDTAYQLRIDPSWNSTGVSVGLFPDATAAFQRQATIERALLEDGWTLESFESKTIDRCASDR